jgi:hypothetical protein
MLGGTVVDENDAVVPAASVSVRDVRTGIKKEATTDRIGLFTVRELPPGNYTVAVQHQGFATAEVRGLSLRVNDQLALKIRLKVGLVGETVTVDAESSVVHWSPAVATTLNRQMVENLPLNGRSFQPVITLTPGVALTRPTFGEQGQFSVNGQRASANYFMVDGVSANIGVAAGADGLGQSGSGSLPGLTALGSTHGFISIDALQEFEILTSTYAPEFGRTPGAQVLLQTRPGGNQFRGSLFEYFRGGALGANDWFANRDRLPKPQLSHHDFGGTLGGPIIKGKTFFFFSYEGLRLRLPQFAAVDVPSMSAREAAPAGLRPLLDAFPVPNGGETANGFLPRHEHSRGPEVGREAVALRALRLRAFGDGDARRGGHQPEHDAPDGLHHADLDRRRDTPRHAEDRPRFSRQLQRDQGGEIFSARRFWRGRAFRRLAGFSTPLVGAELALRPQPRRQRLVLRREGCDQSSASSESG